MMPRACYVSIASLILLAGCASAPDIRYYTLSPPRLPAATQPPLGGLLDVQPVSVPIAVDRQEIVVRDGAQRLQLAEGERWSARLGDEIQAALARSLAARLGMRDVSGLPYPASQEALRLRAAVRSFEATPGGEATLALDWTLGSSRQPAELVCSNRYRSAAGSDHAALVAAQQGLLERFAASVEEAARARAAGRPACPAES